MMVSETALFACSTSLISPARFTRVQEQAWPRPREYRRQYRPEGLAGRSLSYPSRTTTLSAWRITAGSCVAQITVWPSS